MSIGGIIRGLSHPSVNFSARIVDWIAVMDKYSVAMIGVMQNVEECLHSDTAHLMFANSEFLVLFNQTTTDRAELSGC